MATSVEQRGNHIAIALLVALFVMPAVFASTKLSGAKQQSRGLVTIRGTVLNGDGKPVYGVQGHAELVDAGGKPVYDAKGTGFDSSGRKLRTSWVSGNGGKFAVKVRPGRYVVWSDGAMSRAVTLIVPGGKSSVSVTVPCGMPAGYVTVHGTVVTLDGVPKHAIGRVADISGNEMPSWTSDNDGKFKIFLKPGTYRFWTTAAKTVSATLVVAEGESPVSVKVIAKKMGSLIPLQFLKADGTPAANARIYTKGIALNGGGYMPFNTDSLGAVMWNVGDAPIRLSFAGVGIGYAKLEITDDELLFSDKPIIVRFSSDLVSTTCQYVSGRVVEETTGVPLGGVKLYPSRVYKQDDPWNMWNDQFSQWACGEYSADDAISATSHDGDGTFRLGPLPPGDYMIDYGAPQPDDQLVSGRIPMTVPKMRGVEGIQIGYPWEGPAFSLSGRVFEKTVLSPLVSKEITVSVMTYYVPGQEPEHWYRWEPIVRNVVTDEYGNYRLYPVRPGKYKLEAKWGKLSASKIVSIKGDTTGVGFMLH